MTVYVRPPGQYLNQKSSVNVTSRSMDKYHALSPFVLGPVVLYSGFWAQNVENGWQFSKVYMDQTDENDNPTQEYFLWAYRGWADGWAHRYPKGKGVTPEYTWWDGEKLDYIEARKRVYVPLYREAVMDWEPDLFFDLVDMARLGDLVIHDFDAYDHISLGMSLEDVLNNPYQKMGHGFVLAMMIEEELNGRQPSNR